MSPRKRIVILGSGFAGTYAYLELYKRACKRDDIEVVLISDTDSFLFMPLLHEVATGNLPAHSISQPVMSLPQDRLDDFIQARVDALDLDSQAISITKNACGDEARDTISYDYLIMSLGSETAYYNVPGAAEHTYSLKSMEDARRIKNHVLDMFEAAQHTEDPEEIRALLRFVIIGGGPTGVELAGELSDFIGRLGTVYRDLARSAEILIADGGNRILNGLDLWFADEVKEILEHKRNVQVCLNAPAEEVRPDGVTLGGAFVGTRTVIWTAGVRAVSVPLSHTHPVETDERSRRIKVTPELEVPEYKNVFVAGDQAYVVDKDTQVAYTMRAQFAVRQGTQAAENVLAHLDGKPLREFEWNDQGIILSLGDKGALAKVFGIRMSGIAAWIFYRAAYLSKLYGWRTKVRTGMEWLLNLWAPRDISKL